ncbi:MAG: hypothetical protein CL678_06535 [Bdellovibrionaceae bacterium]|nr:hypothetical protein [Pseudobdellovibrionaceae bacterium]
MAKKKKAAKKKTAKKKVTKKTTKKVAKKTAKKAAAASKKKKVAKKTAKKAASKLSKLKSLVKAATSTTPKKAKKTPEKSTKAKKTAPQVDDSKEVKKKKLVTSDKAAKKAPSKKMPVIDYDSDDHYDDVCREIGCEADSISAGYCRPHYIKNWKKIKRKEIILKEGKLNRYIEELVAKYPDKYIDAIRNDISSEKAFSQVVTELELGESIDDMDMEGDDIDSLISNIRQDMDEESEF